MEPESATRAASPAPCQRRGPHGNQHLPTRIPWGASPPRRPRQPGMENLSSGLKKKATEHHYRAEVMIAGEQLR